MTLTTHGGTELQFQAPMRDHHLPVERPNRNRTVQRFLAVKDAFLFSDAAVNELAQIADLKTPTLFSVRAERKRQNADIAISNIPELCLRVYIVKLRQVIHLSWISNTCTVKSTTDSTSSWTVCPRD